MEKLRGQMGKGRIFSFNLLGQCGGSGLGGDAEETIVGNVDAGEKAPSSWPSLGIAANGAVAQQILPQAAEHSTTEIGDTRKNGEASSTTPTRRKGPRRQSYGSGIAVRSADSAGRSTSRSISHSLGHSIGHSVGHSIDHSVGRKRGHRSDAGLKRNSPESREKRADRKGKAAEVRDTTSGRQGSTAMALLHSSFLGGAETLSGKGISGESVSGVRSARGNQIQSGNEGRADTARLLHSNGREKSYFGTQSFENEARSRKHPEVVNVASSIATHGRRMAVESPCTHSSIPEAFRTGNRRQPESSFAYTSRNDGRMHGTSMAPVEKTGALISHGGPSRAAQDAASSQSREYRPMLAAERPMSLDDRHDLCDDLLRGSSEPFSSSFTSQSSSLATLLQEGLNFQLYRPQSSAAVQGQHPSIIDTAKWTSASHSVTAAPAASAATQKKSSATEVSAPASEPSIVVEKPSFTDPSYSKASTPESLLCPREETRSTTNDGEHVATGVVDEGIVNAEAARSKGPTHNLSPTVDDAREPNQTNHPKCRTTEADLRTNEYARSPEKASSPGKAEAAAIQMLPEATAASTPTTLHGTPETEKETLIGDPVVVSDRLGMSNNVVRASPALSYGCKSKVSVLPGRLFWGVRSSSVRSKILEERDYRVVLLDRLFPYNPFYLDFGPNSLAQVYRSYHLFKTELELAEKAGKALIVLSADSSSHKANSLFLLCSFTMLFASQSPERSWRPFEKIASQVVPYRDASYGVCRYQLRIIDCLRGLKRGVELGWFSVEPTKFDIDEYEFYEQLENGDLNWIIPKKILAFSGPTSRTAPSNVFGLPPEFYIPVFKRLNVNCVIRLNQKQYDRSVFVKEGIRHHDLIFPDGSCPTLSVVKTFLGFIENADPLDAFAVHCKAGLGRTGTLIGCYALKYYGFTAAAWIGWNRISRPGSVLGPQQFFLHSIESSLVPKGIKYDVDGRRVVGRTPVNTSSVSSLGNGESERERNRDDARGPGDDRASNGATGRLTKETADFSPTRRKELDLGTVGDEEGSLHRSNRDDLDGAVDTDLTVRIYGLDDHVALRGDYGQAERLLSAKRATTADHYRSNYGAIHGAPFKTAYEAGSLSPNSVSTSDMTPKGK